ncbi:hypothetical protein B0J17DRAFT_721749 [Rhizoctonia solani]|nr:hypothetical protein B0J17DRAFT_721749 [Rhizoctonia solani]
MATICAQIDACLKVLLVALNVYVQGVVGLALKLDSVRKVLLISGDRNLCPKISTQSPEINPYEAFI